MEDMENTMALETMQSGGTGEFAPEESGGAQNEFVENDVADFLRRHPEMAGADILGLIQNQQFRRFCGSRFGRESLAALYEDFMAVVGSAAEAALERAANRRERSTGHGGGNAAVLSPAQKEALDRWNAANPEMKMSAKEFLAH